MKSWVKKLAKAMAGVLAAVLFVGLFAVLSDFGSVTALADAGDPPVTSKTLDYNGDGTYTLELSVTGDADNQTQEAGAVDIVVVYDISQSMTSNAGSSRYSRADQAEDIVHDFLTNLATYRNSEGNNIRVSLVNFAVTGSQVQGWTNDVTGLANRFDDGGTDGRTNFTYNGYGTNWESALQRAQTLVNSSREGVPTFVIMITDGAPTASGNGNNAIAPTGASIAQLRDRYNAATDEARTIAEACEGKNGTFYGIYAYGTEADLLDDLMYFSENGRHRGGNLNNVVAATQDAPNYFNAGETAQLQAAIDEIFDKVVQAMGISTVSIHDGTTNQVRTSNGEMSELLEIVPDSYKYWITIPVVSNQFTRVDRDGNTITYSVTDNGNGTSTVNWTEGGSNKSVTVSGSVASGQFRYEWTEANDLYNYAPNAARLVNGAVDWDLSNVGTLLDGVTYSVTFDVYPSQTTLDTVADIANDPGANGAWSELDPNVQQYIHSDATFETNTTASVTYSDTRLETPGPTTRTIPNPDPITADVVEQLAVSKEWENALDGQAAQPVSLHVTRDGANQYEVELNNTNHWQNSVYISIGIMRVEDNGDVEMLAPGHNYTFTEPEALTHHWEIDVPVVRPMMINGTVTMLIMVDEAHQPENGVTVYENLFGDGEDYYVGSTGAASLTATNYRRSSLNVTKAVDPSDAPDAVFPFTFNVVNSGAAGGSAADINSDYYVWISVWDSEDQPVNDAVVSGATAEDGSNGWYYAPSGTDVVINMHAGYSIRVNNLPTGSTYSVAEGTLPAGFAYQSTSLTATYGSGESAVITTGTDADESFVGAQTSTGTIQQTNSNYDLAFTNQFTPARLTPQVTKTVQGRNATEPFAFSIAAGDDATSAAIADGTIVMPSSATASTSSDALIQDGESETVSFGNIVFYATGTYTFVFDETTTTSAAGWTYDDSTKTMTVVVSAGANGSLVAEATGNNPTFTNTYHAEPVNAQIPVVKNITPAGAAVADITGKFTFTLSAGTNTAGADVETPIPETTTVTSGANGAQVNFPAITFTEPGSYTYYVTESVTNSTETSVDGISLETTEPKAVTVVVTDDGSGQLSAVVNGGDPLEFNNPYTVTAIDISIPVTKILSIPAGLTGPDDITGEYTFTLTGVSNTAGVTTPMPQTTQLTNPAANGGTVTFGTANDPIMITVPGTYTYTVTESGEVNGVTNETPAEKTVTVVVTDNGDGTMSYTVNNGEEISFTNTYGADPTTATIFVRKNITGENAPDITGEYTFTLTGQNGAPMPAAGGETVANPSADGGTASFGAITYDAPGTYTYTVSESGSVAGVVNDTSAQTVTVSVTDGGEGELVAQVSSTENSPVTFTNQYREASVTIPVTKVLSVPAGLAGPGDITGEYTFTLTAGSNTAGVTTPMPAAGGETVMNPAANGGTAQFGAITFLAPGEYTYTVTESGEVNGVTNETPASKTVKVTVTQTEEQVETGDVDDEGNPITRTEYGLEAVITEGNDLTFTNTYFVQPTTASFPVEKILSAPVGANVPDITGKYTFTLTAGTNTAAGSIATPMPAAGGETVTNPDADGGVASFGTITYTAPGTYNYTVTESGSVAGVTNDGTPAKTVTVTVTDNGNGTLSAVASSTADAPLQFTNSYTYTETAVVLQVHKTLTVPEGLTGPGDITGEYTFTLAAGTNTAAGDIATPMPEAGGETVTNPAADGGTASFGQITFTAPGTYTYLVTESGSVAGVTNDRAASTGKTVTVTIDDNGEGSLVPTVDYGNNEGHVTFTNVYSVQPTTASFPVEKILIVPEGLTGPASIANKYTFTLAAGTNTAAGGITTPMPEAGGETVTNPAADGGVASFGTITYTAPGTYNYTVTESGSVAGVTNDTAAATGKTVTVTVTDGGDGTLSAVASSTTDAPLQFTNTYSVQPTTVTAIFTKTVVKMPPNTSSQTFGFSLAGSGSAPMPANTSTTATFTADGQTQTLGFGAITFDMPGTYTYTITEDTADLGNWTVTGNPAAVTVEVSDKGDGTLEAAVTQGQITNTFETVTITGTKTWEDAEFFENGQPLGGYERPAITVNLYGNGELVTSATVTGGTEETWNYSFPNVPKYYNGQEIAYTVTEVTADGYETEIDDFEIVNTPVTDTEVNPAQITVLKVDENTDEPIPTGAEFTLTLPDGSTQTLTTGSAGTLTIDFTEAGTYTLAETKAPEGYSQDDLPSYTITVTEALNSIVLKVKEDQPVWTWIWDLLTGVSSDYDADTQTLTVPNPPETTQVTVEKVWDDADDQDGVRPATVTFTLTGTANGTSVYTDTQQVAVSADGTSYTWEELPAYCNGREVTYEVTEAAVAQYTSAVGEMTEVTDEDGNVTGYTVEVTNTHETGTREISVTKVWQDANNADGLRPASVTVQLYANGTATGTAVTLNAANNWTYTWTGLAVSENGSTITYTVKETSVPTGYTASYSGDALTGFTITNTHAAQPPIVPTGDGSRPIVWVACMLGAAVALCGVTAVTRRRRAR